MHSWYTKISSFGQIEIIYRSDLEPIFDSNFFGDIISWFLPLWPSFELNSFWIWRFFERKCLLWHPVFMSLDINSPPVFINIFNSTFFGFFSSPPDPFKEELWATLNRDCCLDHFYGNFAGLWLGLTAIYTEFVLEMINH